MIYNIITICVSILLVLSVLLQHRGTSLGGAFGGGEMNVYRSRRGAEKFLFYATIVLAVILVALILIQLWQARNI